MFGSGKMGFGRQRRMKDKNLHGSFQSSKDGEAQVGTRSGTVHGEVQRKSKSGLPGVRLMRHHPLHLGGDLLSHPRPAIESSQSRTTSPQAPLNHSDQARLSVK